VLGFPSQAKEDQPGSAVRHSWDAAWRPGESVEVFLKRELALCAESLVDQRSQAKQLVVASGPRQT
jgi:hypothetical protein